MFRRFIALSAVTALFVSMAVPVAANHRSSNPSPPPPDPVEINVICFDRIQSGWKIECEQPIETILFDGVTQHLFCFINQNNDYDGILSGTVERYGRDTGECATNAVPVTLTGDNSVEVCIYPGNRIAQRGSPLCLEDAVI